MRHALPACLLGFTLLAGPGQTQETAIPKTAQGVWAPGGKCHGDTVTFTAHGLQYKGQTAARAYYAPDDSPTGNGAIHYVEERNVDGSEYLSAKDEMIYHPEGYGTGLPVLYKRCR